MGGSKGTGAQLLRREERRVPSHVGAYTDHPGRRWASCGAGRAQCRPRLWRRRQQRWAAVVRGGSHRRRGAAARRNIDLTPMSLTAPQSHSPCAGSGARPPASGPTRPKNARAARGRQAGGARSARRRRRRRRRQRRRRAASSHSIHIFSCFLLLLRDQVGGERGRRAGWARSASRRVAVVGAHLRRP